MEDVLKGWKLRAILGEIDGPFDSTPVIHRAQIINSKGEVVEEFLNPEKQNLAGMRSFAEALGGKYETINED